MKRRIVLALNCGSSSLKFGLYKAGSEAAELLIEGEAEEIGREGSRFWTKGLRDKSEQREIADHPAALAATLDALKEADAPLPEAAGHRFVHGGPTLREHSLLNKDVKDALQAAVSYAPLHVPPALAVLNALQQTLPEIPQVVCLDTAFHREMPLVSKTFALPKEFRQQGIERYGFHGLSLESILPQLDRMPDRVVIAHLGNGSSITAVLKGKSIDTTMGLTPTGGVMMGTRCGDLDPGLMVYLLRSGFSTAERLEKLFDYESGLLGISGKTNDVRELLQMRANDPQADLALAMFCYQVRKAIAGMAGALGGLDALVFTGGIGENAKDLRREICSGLKFLELDAERVLVVPAQEDLQIAKITARLAGSPFDAENSGGLRSPG